MVLRFPPTIPSFPSPLSPMMAQWRACKERAPEGLLLFRLGDFYEAFYEDAAHLAEAVEVTLTQRQGIPMAGIPAQAAEGYLSRLMEKGWIVAIAEQVEEAKGGKGLVRREVTRILSPATYLSAEERGNTFFASLSSQEGEYALAFLDLSTGELYAMEVEGKEGVKEELYRKKPPELLLAPSEKEHSLELLKEAQSDFPLHVVVRERRGGEEEERLLLEHFSLSSLDGLGIRRKKGVISAVASLFRYLKEELLLPLDFVSSLVIESPSSYLSLDLATQRNLELVESLRPLEKGERGEGTLLALLDHTLTPMGRRLLKSWVLRPLRLSQPIIERQEKVAFLLSHLSLRDSLSSIRDIEKLFTRSSCALGTPRELLSLKRSLQGASTLCCQLTALESPLFSPPPFSPQLTSLVKKLEEALADPSPSKLGEGETIASGFDCELDRLRLLQKEGASWMANYQLQLREQTEIKTLRVVYSKAFGYSIEVSRLQGAKLSSPPFHKRQTLVNTERFFTNELKEYEEELLSAEEQIKVREASLFSSLKEEVKKQGREILEVAKRIALLDLLLSLSWVAKKYGYTRPEIHEGRELSIKEGRHPCLENTLPPHLFIPNDATFTVENPFFLLTGPNMGGKSTYLRQTALLVLLAQIGSFIPAKESKIGIVDKIFSRIGASDDLRRGQSTFMVEMSETAYILRSATPSSLVILDEVGRGTSTFDGISLAWAIAERLLEIGCKTIFATHYFELTHLPHLHQGAQNMHVSVEEGSSSLTFLHKIGAGRADKSYGIHVARLAGVPLSTLERATCLLKGLEEGNTSFTLPACPLPSSSTSLQSEKVPDLLRDKLSSLDLLRTTPLQALQLLEEWQHTFLSP